MSGALLSIAILQVLTILVGLLRAKGLAILLGPADFGVVSTIDQVVVTLVTFGGLAMPFTAMKFMARGHSEGEEVFRRTGAGFLRLLTGLGVLTAGIASLAVVAVPGLFGADLVPFHRAVQVAVLGVPSALLLILLVNILAAAQRPAAGAAANLIGITALAAAAVAGAWWRGIDGLYIASVLSAIATTIAGFTFLARGLGIRLVAPHAGVFTALRAQPAIITNAAAFYAMMCASTLVMLVVRTTVLSQLGAEAAGRLQAAFSLALTVGAVLLPITNLVLVPRVNRAGSVMEKNATANDFASRMMILLLLGALPVVVVPGELLHVLYSSAFVPTASVLWLFVVWQCVFQVMYVYQQLLVGFDDTIFVGCISVAGFASAMLLGGPLVSWLGLAGVAVALALGMTITGCGLVIRLVRRHGGQIPGRVGIRFLGLLAVVSVAGVLFAEPVVLGFGMLRPRIGFILAVLLLTWLALDDDERDPKRWLAMMRPTRDATTPL